MPPRPNEARRSPESRTSSARSRRIPVADVLLFSSALTSPVLAEKRQASTTIFIGLLAANAKTFYRLNDSGHLTLTATFLVGGLAQTLSAWLDGYIDVTEEELVAECAAILLAPALPPS